MSEDAGGRERRAWNIQVAEGDVVLECEGPLVVRNLVEPDARSEVRLDLGESHDGTVWNFISVKILFMVLFEKSYQRLHHYDTEKM